MEQKLANFLNASALVLALPYFAGFVYLHGYFEYYNVSVTELKLDESYIYINAFAFALNALVRFTQSVLFAPIFITITIVVLSFVALGFRPKQLKFRLITGYHGLIAVYGIAVTVVYFAAYNTGVELAKQHANELPGAYLLRTTDEKVGDIVSKENLATPLTGYKHLFTTEKTFYLVRMKPRNETFTVLRVPITSQFTLANIKEKR